MRRPRKGLPFPEIPKMEAMWNRLTDQGFPSRPCLSGKTGFAICRQESSTKTLWQKLPAQLLWKPAHGSGGNPPIVADLARFPVAPRAMSVPENQGLWLLRGRGGRKVLPANEVRQPRGIPAGRADPAVVP